MLAGASPHTRIAPAGYLGTNECLALIFFKGVAELGDIAGLLVVE